jgi:DNA-binding XRE family transcriptional regulator
MTIPAKLRQLRSVLSKTQKEFSAIIGVSKDTIESLEQGRLKLSPKLALRISRMCGVDHAWLNDDANDKEMINEYGEPYTLRDFEECQERDASLSFYLAAEEMQIAIAYDRLVRAYREARATHQVPHFIKTLERFVQAQVHQFPGLKIEIEEENVERNKRQRKIRPYLFPGGVEPLKRARRKLNEAIAAFADWEVRMNAMREKMREKRLENPDTLSATDSPVERNKSPQK